MTPEGILSAFYWLNLMALWIGALCYARHMERRDKFGMRLVLCTGLYLIFSIVLKGLLLGAFIDAGIYVRILWYVVVSCFLFICWKIPVSIASYYGIWAFMSWQLLYELWIMIRAIIDLFYDLSDIADLIGNMMIFVAGYTFVATTISKWMMEGRKQIGPRQLSSGLLIFWIFEVMGMAQRRISVTASDSRWELLYLTQVLIAVVLYLQNEMFKKSALRQELTIMNMLHQKEKEQYELAKENIDLINQKCHDLKHQIRALKQVGNEELDRYLTEMEESVGIYESIVKTGNEALDTLLTEKSLSCKRQEILVSCVADGSLLDFMDTIDLYALFGNALDNAIEAVGKFEEKEKRLIDVLVYKEKNFLIINIINPMPERLTYEDEIPVTTKEDKAYHGFGIRSMRHIVKKYDGHLNIEEMDGCFSLKILIPIPKENSIGGRTT